MLTRHLGIKQQLPRFIYIVTHHHHHHGKNYSTQNEIEEIIGKPELRLSPHKLKLKPRSPFAKNFYLGLYDTEFCAFPEPQSHERHKEFENWLKPIDQYISTTVNPAEIDETRKIPDQVFDNFKELDIYRAQIPEAYKGLELNNSEYSRLVETVSKVPVLGAYLAKRALAVNYLMKFGSEEQKERYLPRIATGELNPTFCTVEHPLGFDESEILASASRSPCNSFWTLNGEKTFVADSANANLFIVFAECSENNVHIDKSDTISSFIVERDFGGITVEPPVDTLGLRGLSLSKVVFKDTVIPKDNMIGGIGSAANNFVSMYTDGRQNFAGQAIGISKRFLKVFIRMLKSQKNFNSELFKSDAVQEVIAKISCTIYAMESVLYLTTGMMDTFANQDCDMEKCIVQTFCSEACLQNIVESITLLGISTQIKGSPIEVLLRDALALHSVNGPLSITKNFIALLGLSHAGTIIAEDVHKHRNLIFYPLYVLMKQFQSMRADKNLYIADNLHPTLKGSAKLLEQGINKLFLSIQTTSIRHGADTINRKMDLRRLSHATCYLYVMAAILARASRAYCLGFQHAERDVNTAQIYAYMIYLKMNELLNEVNDNDHNNGDILLQVLSDVAFEKSDYFFAHPLDRIV